MAQRSTRTSQMVQVVVVILVLSGCFAGFYLHRHFINDDTYISLRYAHNFVEGHGPVWNPGERAEGYTNFLHVVLTAGFGTLGMNLVTAARWLNGIAFAVLALLLATHVRRGRHDEPPTDWLVDFMPVAIVLTASPLISWIFGGLEGPLFTMLCAGGVLYFMGALEEVRPSRDLMVSSILFAGATLTRPDGILFLMTSLGALVVMRRREHLPALKPLLALMIPYVCIYGTYYLWRYGYYGQLMPLTFYVKATGFDLFKGMAGLRYIGQFLIAPPYLLAITVPAVLLAWRRRALDYRAVYLLSVTLVYLTYIVYVGGDYMYSFRLMLPLIPVLALLLHQLTRPLLNRLSIFKLGVVWVILFALVGFQYAWTGTDVRPMLSRDYIATHVGQYIDQAWPHGSLVALNTAGATPYFALDHRYIDMLGLNDVHIARRVIDSIRIPWQRIPGHYKGDGHYVLDRDPDFIIVGPAAGTSIDLPWFLSDHEMSEDPRFRARYEGIRVRLADFVFTYYQRRN